MRARRHRALVACQVLIGQPPHRERLATPGHLGPRRLLRSRLPGLTPLQRRVSAGQARLAHALPRHHRRGHRHGRPLPQPHLTHPPVRWALEAVHPSAPAGAGHQAQARRLVHRKMLPRQQRAGRSSVELRHSGNLRRRVAPRKPTPESTPLPQVQTSAHKCITATVRAKPSRKVPADQRPGRAKRDESSTWK